MKEVEGDTSILDKTVYVNGTPLVNNMPDEFVLVLAKELCDEIALDTKKIARITAMYR